MSVNGLASSAAVAQSPERKALTGNVTLVAAVESSTGGKFVEMKTSHDLTGVLRVGDSVFIRGSGGASNYTFVVASERAMNPHAIPLCCGTLSSSQVDGAAFLDVAVGATLPVAPALTLVDSGGRVAGDDNTTSVLLVMSKAHFLRNQTSGFSISGNNRFQQIRCTRANASASGGFISLRLGAFTTGPLPASATVSDVATQLLALPGLAVSGGGAALTVAALQGSQLCTAHSSESVFEVRFAAGATFLGSSSIPLLGLGYDNVRRFACRADPTYDGGFFTFTVGGQSSFAVPANASAAEVRSKLLALDAMVDVDVTFTNASATACTAYGWGEVVITIKGTNGLGLDASLLTIGSRGLVLGSASGSVQDLDAFPGGAVVHSSGSYETTAVMGIATFDGVSLPLPCAACQLSFVPLIGGTVGARFDTNDFAVRASAPAGIRVLTHPSTEQIGLAFAQPPVIELVDAGGNRVTDATTNADFSTLSVRARISRNPCGGAVALQGTTVAPFQSATGTASFQGIIVSAPCKGLRLEFSMTRHVVSPAFHTNVAASVLGFEGVQSRTFDVAGTASSIRFAMTPSNVISGTNFATSLKVADAHGTDLRNVSGTIALRLGRDPSCREGCSALAGTGVAPGQQVGVYPYQSGRACRACLVSLQLTHIYVRPPSATKGTLCARRVNRWCELNHAHTAIWRAPVVLSRTHRAEGDGQHAGVDAAVGELYPAVVGRRPCLHGDLEYRVQRAGSDCKREGPGISSGREYAGEAAGDVSGGDIGSSRLFGSCSSLHLYT